MSGEDVFVGDPTAAARGVVEEPAPAEVVEPTPAPVKPPTKAPPPAPPAPSKKEPEYDWEDEVIATASADGSFFDTFMSKLWPAKFTKSGHTPVTTGSQLVLRHRRPRSRMYIAVEDLERAGVAVPAVARKRFRDSDVMERP